MVDFFQRIAGLFGGNDEPSSRAERLVMHGMPVVLENTRPDIASADVLERLAEALDLIAMHQPWRLRHLQRDITAIKVVRFPSRGAFMPDDRTIITELTFLARRDITAAPVASSIIHEGVHARCNAFGVLRQGHADLAREERLCRRAELAFGQALPEALGAPVIERALASLALEDLDVAPVIDWQEAQRRQEAVDRAAGGSA